MLQFINVNFKKPVSIENQDVEFINCTFSAEGATMKDAAGTALTILGSVNTSIINCVFKNKGYNSILLKTTGKVNIERNTFYSSEVYNPIECAGRAGEGLNNIVIKNNIFSSTCGNNYISFFHMANDAMVEIERNIFSNVKYESNILRLSNPENAAAIFQVSNNTYQYNSNDVSDYTAFLICQEYGSVAQDFTKYIVNFTNLKCNNSVVTETPAQGVLYYSYKDGVGIVTGQNDPVISIG